MTRRSLFPHETKGNKGSQGFQLGEDVVDERYVFFRLPSVAHAFLVSLSRGRIFLLVGEDLRLPEGESVRVLQPSVQTRDGPRLRVPLQRRRRHARLAPIAHPALYIVEGAAESLSWSAEK
jgi:hypothetical protein